MKFKFFLLTLAFFALGITTYAQMLRDEIVVNFPFNGNALDFSGHQLDGTIYNTSPSTDRFSAVNGCFYFDGVESMIEIPIATDFLQIKNEDGVSFGKYWIYNTQGQLIKSGTAEGQISIKSLNSGLYTLKVESDELVYVKYFIRE